MPPTPFHPDDGSSKQTGRLGRLTKREAASLASLKVLARKQGLSLGLVRGPGEQNDVCLLRFLRAQGFEEKRALASLVSCVEWGAGVGLSGLRGHPGVVTNGASAPPPLPAAAGLVCLGPGLDRLGRPLVFVRLGGLSHSLVEACGKKPLLRYFIWTVERCLEQVAVSMLSTQFIIEGSAVVCDVRGWSLESASDSVLAVLQDAANIGLARYPERLGQLFVVNVPAPEAVALLIAARALGLGRAIDTGKLRVMPGELPKWAPELRKAISPEHLPVEYGGTAPALPTLPAALAGGSKAQQSAGVAAAGDSVPSDARDADTKAQAAPNKPSPGKGGGGGGLLRAILVIVKGIGGGGGVGDGGNGGTAGGPRPFASRTSYEIGGAHAIALLLTLWALHRENPRLGESALLALAVALLARELVGGPATLPSSEFRVPLLHDPRALVAAASEKNGGSGGNGGGCANLGGGDVGGGSISGAAGPVGMVGPDGGGGRRLVGVSLVGAVVEVVEVVGRGKSGFDRFCIKVMEAPRTPAGSSVAAHTFRRQWVTWRRLTEFVALRAALVEAGCSEAEGVERDTKTRMWALPPVVPFGLLMQRLEAWLRRVLRDDRSARREELRRFLLDAPRPTSTPRTTASATATATPSGASTNPPAEQAPASQGGSVGAAAVAAATTGWRRRTAPTVLSTVHEPLSPISAERAVGPGYGAACPDEDSLALEAPAEKAGGGRSGGGGAEAREIPSLRPEIKSMFRDPGECHSLKIPQRGHNQWLRRANRTSATASSSSSSSPAPSSPSPGSSLPRPPSAESLGAGRPLEEESDGSHLRLPPWADGGSGSDAAGHDGSYPVTPPNTVASAWATTSPVGKAGGAAEGKRGGAGASPFSHKKEGTASPRRREALKRFVSLVKRKGGGKRGGGGVTFAAGFRLLHVDVFQVPPGNHLHRVDHIVGRAGGRAQAKVKELTAKKPGGYGFLFVVNLQLPRSFTRTTAAASVVLYWGVPAECLGGAGTSSLDPSLSTPPPQPQPRAPQRSSSLATAQPSASAAAAAAAAAPAATPPHRLAAFERELMMRYIDLPFHRMDPHGSGFVSSAPTGPSAASGSGSGSALMASWEKGVSGKRAGSAHGVPGFSAVDEDESESGVFSDKDFRNMSLKVVTSVVEGRWTVRKAVDEGNSQVLSRKLTQRYFRGSLYMETDIEIGSSVAAESVVGVCLTEPSVLDVGFFLEGGHRVLGCVRVNNLKLAAAEPLLLVDSAPPPPPPLEVSTPPGMGISPTTKSMAAAAARKSSAFGPPRPPATTAAAGGAAGRRGDRDAVPLGNPQFQATWEENGDSHAFRVRGPGYLSGGGKVDAGSPFGKLVRADLFKMEAGVDRMDNIGSVGRAAKVVRRLRKKGKFLVIVNLQVPGNPPLSMVLYYAVPVPPGGVPEEGAGGRSPAFLNLFRRFVDLGPKHNSDEDDGEEVEGAEGGTDDAGGGGRLPGDDLRNLRFKLFPAILKGPWIVRKAVGSKPTLIAQKLTCRYFRTRSYFEVDIDIGSSVVAYNTVSLAIGYAKGLVVDMGFCVQGEADDELPEVMLGVVRIRKLDVLLADNLDASEDPEDADSEEEDDDDDDDDIEVDGGGNGGGEDCGAPVDERKDQEEEGGTADRAGTKGSPPSGSSGRAAAAGTGSLGPNDAATGASVFAIEAGGGAHGADPITSPGLERVFTDSGTIHGLRVRGSSYLRDRRKIFAGPSFGTLIRADLFRVDGNRHHLFRVDHICAHGRMKDRVAFLQSGENPPFLFIVNIQMPGDRAHSVVLCWGMRLKEAKEAEAGGRLSKEDGNFLRLFSRYISLDLEGGLPVNDIRNRRLKLFPKVLEGPWVVRKAVGKPCVIGKKLTARYFRRPGYFEVDIDVGSSTLASNATHLAGGYAKNLVLDLAFALQGESEDELPERLLGSARIARPDLGRAEPLDW